MIVIEIMTLIMVIFLYGSQLTKDIKINCERLSGVISLGTEVCVCVCGVCLCVCGVCVWCVCVVCVWCVCVCVCIVECHSSATTPTVNRQK